MRVPAQRRFRLLVFDWDGTLSDSTAIIADAIRSACRDLGEPVPDEATARYVIGLGLTDALRLVAPGLPLSRHSELTVLYRRYYLAREDDIPLFAGASGLLAELEAAGYLLAVATGKSRLGLARVLARSVSAGRPRLDGVVLPLRVAGRHDRGPGRSAGARSAGKFRPGDH